MLHHLEVYNLAIIEHVAVDFSEGFNVLTGETGAGKSILIDALTFVLGERASHDIIRHGSDSCRVEAAFDICGTPGVVPLLSEYGIDCPEDEVILSRALTAAGKSTCRINGVLVSLNQQKAIGDFLVDVHGQHEHQALLVPSRHIGYLDKFCGGQAASLLDRIDVCVGSLRAAQTRLNAGFTSPAERERRADILKYQINEIDSAALSEDEETALTDEKHMLANAEKIRAALENGCSAIVDEDGSALELVKRASDAMRDIAAYSAEYRALADTLDEVFYSLDDTARSLQEMRADFDFDPARLDEIEMRLDRIADMKRKYGKDITAIIAFADSCRAELDEMNNSESVRAALQHECDALSAEYADTAGRLSSLRHEYAGKLADRIVAELAQLGMPRAAFETRFGVNPVPTPRGMDTVEFFLAANAGEPLRPLARVASGGEISRIMLSLKVALSGADEVGTMVFDEIDSGISGRIASITGEKLCAISRAHQVLCITHLPQIAAYADEHYLIEKNESADRATTSVRRIDGNERTKEVARIMGDSCASALAEQYAAELIRNCEKVKGNLRAAAE